MKSRRWFTRPQAVFLVVVANASLVVIGSLLLARYRGADGRDVHATLDSITHQLRHDSSSGYYAVPPRQIESFEFDPNVADSTQLLRLGLAPFQVRSIYRYRANGGRFCAPDDFRRVYRLTNEQWEHLAPLIRIADRYRLVAVVPSADERNALVRPRPSSRNDVRSGQSHSKASSSLTDSISDSVPSVADLVSDAGKTVQGNYPRKLSGDETLDVNLADSALLCRVPGIGPYFARKIVEYRRRLGGYADVEQLLQIDNFPADAIAWLEVTDSMQIKRLKVNNLTTRQLMKHPYMGYYRASDIVTHRRIYGRVTGLDILKGLQHFTEEDIRRLEPYLDFD
ncbi:MAG: helix-hairpin-helix domain-containing protein [Paraprevotella sp.]|nr:helix-hairpin-helix domain-containing protein [Paraprevotella sp.]